MNESIISTTFTGRIEGLTKVGDLGVRPSISGRPGSPAPTKSVATPRIPLARLRARRHLARAERRWDQRVPGALPA